MTTVKTYFKQENSGEPNRQGSVLVLAAFLSIVILAFTAFMIDLGYISMVKSQLQNAADSAAMATILTYSNSTLEEQARLTDAEDWAVNFAELNQPEYGELLRNADITLGTWDAETKTFVETNDSPTAAKVVVKRASGNGNELPLFIAPVLGYSTIDVSATAIAIVGQDTPRDIMLVIDTSGSMDDHNRMAYTKSAAAALIDELVPSDRLGLAVYSYPIDKKTQTGYLEKSLSFNHDSVSNKIPTLQAGMYSKWTNIAGGMRVALDELRNNPRTPQTSVEKIMVLMTDGHANKEEPPETSPVQSIVYYANLAASEKVIIHGITLGNNADKIWISKAASLTGGEYYHVKDGDYQGLLNIFRKIGNGDGRVKLVK